jgi:glycosyltransferase involved in cell wall biosynthesis
MTPQPLRVALISPSFGGYGGMEAFALALATGFHGHPDVELTVAFKRTKGFALRPELRAATAPLAARVQFIDRAGPALWRALRAADVVHSFNASPDTLLAARLLRRPVLLTVINHRQPHRSLRQFTWQAGLRLAPRRTFISEFVRRSWEGPNVRPGSEVVFPLCELASGSVPPKERRGFVFAARWIAGKGLETLVNAYAEAALDPEVWPLVLIGDGPLRPRVLQAIATRGLRGVSAPGFLPAEEKAAAIRRARWMVVPPQTNEDFGLTALEARHLGVPCIATRDGGVPEAAGAEALLCDPGDVAGLAGCLRAAAALSAEDYVARATRTRETLLPQLAGPARYASLYRALASRP